MAEEAEQAFIKTFLSTLSAQRVIYKDDYQQSPANSLKKVPVLPIAVPPPPKRAPAPASVAGSSTSVAAPTLALTFKSLKPPVSFQLSVDPTDTIASIKSQLATLPKAPPADAQRFLLKGKALADNKLLKEYYLKDNDTVTVSVKPGTVWDPTKPTATTSSPSPIPTPPQPEQNMTDEILVSPTPQHGQKRGHQRIPSVVLSPSPSGEKVAEKDILLTLDNTNPANVSVESLSSYGVTVAQPAFWKRLYDFLKSEFHSPTDALQAWEDYFCASKGSLTANQIAKIRDTVGIVGMAGT
ncbi:hypothetical protein C0991_009587 [Blastosporella zonata]|nr:hypothetical protein C0991_009587 [Blastosporella zonata]